MSEKKFPEKKFPDVVYRGKTFEMDDDGWIHLSHGDEYMIALSHTCCWMILQVSCFEPETDLSEEKTRRAALDHACAELYLIVTQHEARCPQCQADIVQGLFRSPRQRQPKQGDPQ